MPIKRNGYKRLSGMVMIELYHPFTKEVEDYAYISEIDIDLAKTIFWYKTKHGYARGYDKASGRCIFLHKLITGTDSKTIIDHINRNKLDCRRENLRIVNKQANSLNRETPSNSTSRVVGVSFDKRKQKYRAYAKLNGKQVFLGYYSSLDDAASARKEYERVVIDPLLAEFKKCFPDSEEVA